MSHVDSPLVPPHNEEGGGQVLCDAQHPDPQQPRLSSLSVSGFDPTHLLFISTSNLHSPTSYVMSVLATTLLPSRRSPRRRDILTAHSPYTSASCSSPVLYPPPTHHAAPSSPITTLPTTRYPPRHPPPCAQPLASPAPTSSPLSTLIRISTSPPAPSCRWRYALS